MRTLTMQSSLGRVTIITMAVLVAAAIAFNVVGNIEHFNSTQLITKSLKGVLGYSLLAVGLVFTVGGFGLIRRAPWLGAVLAVGGSWVPALMLFWLVLPLFIAAGVSIFAILWAQKQANVA